MDKAGGFTLFTQVLKSPRHLVAPMVDQSELGWRLLSRKYGAHLTYTPMINAKLFARDKVYREKLFTTSPEDRPLIAQFCGDDPESLVAAAKLVETRCDAVDLNLGCPQHIARKGHYGAFLQDEWELISSIVKALHESIAIPVTCKIRVFDDKEKTLKYAQMLQDSGCQLLTVHGRTRVMKGPKSGIANWDTIRAIKEQLTIPVVANGNILYFSDIEQCMQATHVDAVMSAETQLYNPGIFNNTFPIVWEMCREMLDYAEQYNSAFTAAKAHMFRLCHKFVHEYADIRSMIANSHSIDDLRKACDAVEKALSARRDQEYAEGLWDAETDKLDGEVYGVSSCDPSFEHPRIPIWRCQPKPRNHARDKEVVELNELPVAQAHGARAISLAVKRGKSARKKELKRAKLEAQPPKQKKKYTPCAKCTTHPSSAKCDNGMCRTCCKAHSIEHILNCMGHNFRIKDRREQQQQQQQQQQQDIELQQPQEQAK